MQESLREFAALGNLDALQTYLRHYPNDLNSVNPVNGWSCAHWAASRNHLAVLKWLVSKGVDLTLKTSNGKTVSELAKGDCVDYLNSLGLTVSPRPIEQEGFLPNYLQNPELGKVWSDGKECIDPMTLASQAHLDTLVRQNEALEKSRIKKEPETSLLKYDTIEGPLHSRHDKEQPSENTRQPDEETVVHATLNSRRQSLSETPVFIFQLSKAPIAVRQVADYKIPLGCLQVPSSSSYNDVLELAQNTFDSDLKGLQMNSVLSIYKESQYGWIRIHSKQRHDILDSTCLLLSSQYEPFILE